MNQDILIQCGDHFENQQRILPLAKFLKTQGYNPIVLLYSKDKGNLFFQHAIDTISLNTFFTRKNIYLTNIYLLFFKKFDTFEIKDVKLKDFYELDILKAPYLFTKNKVKYRVKIAIRYILALESIIKTVNPSFIFVWNGYTGNVANGLRLLSKVKSINSAFLERGLFNESVFVDFKGTNGSSELSDIKYFTNTDIKFKNTLKVVQQVSYEKRISQNKKVVFLPLQVQKDTNILLYSYEIKKMFNLIDIVSKNISKEYILIVRPHPEEDKNEKVLIPKKNNIVVTTKGNLDCWIQIADVIVTINSTVGLEALLEYKKVISFGKSIYSNKNLVLESSRATFKKDFDNIDNFVVNEKKVNIYYNYLIEHHICMENYINKRLNNEFPKKTLLKIPKYFNSLGLSLKDLKYLDTNIDTKKIKKVRLFVKLDNIYVNLTYRKNRQLITEDYLLKYLKKFIKINFDLDYDFLNMEVINYNKYTHKYNAQFYDILMLDEGEKEINFTDKFNVILDPYFNLHSLFLKI